MSDRQDFFNNLTEPFYVCSVDTIIKQHKLWKKHVPFVEPYYCVASNDSRIVIDILHALGAGFVCDSDRSIKRVCSLGIDLTKIVHTKLIKCPQEIQFSANMGIDYMTFCDEFEMHKIYLVNRNAKLILKINIDGCQLGELPDKLGPQCYTTVETLLRKASQLGANIVGLSLDSKVDSEPTQFYRKLVICWSLYEKAQKLGFLFTFLNIGGGYPSDEQEIIKIAEYLNMGLGKSIPPNLKIIAELSNFYVDPAFVYVSKVEAKKERVREGLTILDFEYEVKGHFEWQSKDNTRNVPKLLNDKSENIEVYSTTIFYKNGAIMKELMRSEKFPELLVGDWLIFKNMGIYRSELTGPQEVSKLFLIVNNNIWNWIKCTIDIAPDHYVMGSSSENGTIDGIQEIISQNNVIPVNKKSVSVELNRIHFINSFFNAFFNI